MSNNKALEVNIPNFEAAQRYSYALAASETIGLGQWFTLNAAGEAIISPADPIGINLLYLNWQDSADPSVSSPQGDNFFGNTPAVTIATGGVVGFLGKFRCTVDNTGYDDGETYAQNDPLTVIDGLLTPQTGATQPIVAYVEIVIGADARLHFVLA